MQITYIKHDSAKNMQALTTKCVCWGGGGGGGGSFGFKFEI